MVDITQTQHMPTSMMIRRNHFDSSRMAGSVPVWETTARVVVPEGDVNEPTILKIDETGNKTNAPSPRLSFGEFLDVVNPLHHIPVVNNLYRKYTGDEISPVAQIIGDGIYGGPIGAVASIVNAAMQEHSGQTMADTVTNAFSNRPVSDAPSREVRLTQKEMPPQKQQWHFNT